MDSAKFQMFEPYKNLVKNIGMVGERKAIALLSLGFYATIFSLMALIFMGQMPEWVPCFAGLAVCYAIGFFALAADWFWGRWFGIGLGNSGLTMALFAMVSTREIGGPMLVFGIMHGLIALCLLGDRMAGQYEAKPEWKERWRIDEAGVTKVRRTVTRAASSLPSLIMFALAPREGAAAGLLVLAGIGLFGLLRGRTWGVLALLGTAVGALAASTFAPSYLASEVMPLSVGALGFLGGALLLTATLPFVPPMVSYLVRRR